jgi:4-hydroxy-tetrahydrodipicolinate reductase
MSHKRIAIVGITGRMGTEILGLAREQSRVVTGGVASLHDGIFQGVPVHSQMSGLDAAKTDVVVDFSLPELTDEVIAWCDRNEKPLVCGVTGLPESTQLYFMEASKRIPILWSPNMSVGVALVARMLSNFSRLEDFEFQIEELHHKRKKDRPSGTAAFLQQKLKDAVKTEVPEPLAIRGGGIFGIHRIWAMGEEETISIEHTAMNRRVFARGALRATEWILGKPAGLYHMDDML